MLKGKQLFIFDFHKISSIHRILFHRTKQKTFLSARNKKEKKKENVKTWMEPERVPFEYSWNGHVNDDRRSKNSIRKN